MDAATNGESLAMFQTSAGVDVRATVMRLSRHSLVCEIYSPFLVLQKSEVLTELKVLANDRPVYGGRAVVTNLIHTPGVSVCEVALEDGWLEVDFFGQESGQNLGQDFRRFLESVHYNLKVLPEFKIAVGDMQSMLMDLRRWLEQIELGIRSQPGGNRDDYERKIVEDLRPSIMPVIGEMFERFNAVADRIPGELRAAHRYYAKRQLHPLVLCAPFMYRTFAKPLGFAGDYEMVNMMVRDCYEGASVFAKVLNTFFLNTPPVVAHRNRLQCLTDLLIQEASRAARDSRTFRVFNLGCGPAQEVQAFLSKSELSHGAEFSLLDFNDETVMHVEQAVNQAKAKYQRGTAVRVIKKSVSQLLKEASKPVSKLGSGTYDFVYCSGLFDYMPNQICEKLAHIFYDLLAPGGLLAVTNVESSNPSRSWMEYMVDWHLEYRTGKQMEAFRPAQAPLETSRVSSELSGLNIFLEVRRPKNA